jgi:hypothetical protein
MKRKNYVITSDAGHKVVKHAWNASIREIERFVREFARAENMPYSLTGTNSVKEGFDYVSGYREWTRADGKAIMFDIEMER